VRGLKTLVYRHYPGTGSKNGVIDIEAISKNGFWFKVAADARFNPEEYSCILRI